MPSSQFAGSFVVSIGMQVLPADIEPLLTSAWVESSLHLPDAAELRFRDPDRVVLGKAGVTIGVPLTVAAQSTESAASVPLFDGEVTAVEAEIDGEGTFTVVRGYDKAHRLRGGRTPRVYQQMTYDQIAAKIAQSAGLLAGTITPTRVVHPHVSQGCVDDWTFLRAMAAEVGYRVRMRAGRLDFCPPPKASTGPDPRSGPGNDPYVLEPGEDLLALRAVVSGAQQVDVVEVRAWDQKAKNLLTGKATAATTSAVLRDAEPAKLAGAFTAHTHRDTATPFLQQSEVNAAAKAVADDIASASAELDGVVRGDPRLVAGHPVAIANLGSPFDGRYTLTRARHAFTPEEGYTTTVAVTGAADRSLLGLASGGSPGTAPAGPVEAVVTDAKDPQNLGRVKVKLPWLADDFVTDWAPTVQLGAGPGRGTLVVPEVDDQVLVGFSCADLRRPYVLGGLYSVKDKPPAGTGPVSTSGPVIRRAFVTRTGHRLEFQDNGTGAKPGIILGTGDGKLTLGMDQHSTALTVHSDGSVTIESATGVRISADRGDINLAGTKIVLDAKSGVDIKGPEVKVNAQGSLALSGTSASLQGTGTAEVKSSGPTTVSGAIVRIN